MVSPATLFSSEQHCKIEFLDRVVAYLNNKRITLVNEHRCPVCQKWDHEYDNDSTWRYKNPNPDSWGHEVEIKTCGNCGYESQWIDTGFMGVMACIDERVPEHGAFYHLLPK